MKSCFICSASRAPLVLIRCPTRTAAAPSGPDTARTHCGLRMDSAPDRSSCAALVVWAGHSRRSPSISLASRSTDQVIVVEKHDDRFDRAGPSSLRYRISFPPGGPGYWSVWFVSRCGLIQTPPIFVVCFVRNSARSASFLNVEGLTTPQTQCVLGSPLSHTCDDRSLLAWEGTPLVRSCGSSRRVFSTLLRRRGRRHPRAAIRL